MVGNFSDERDWGQFHNAKELAIGIVTEASELLQLFRFKSEKQMDEMFEDSQKKEKITEEISDILFFTLRLCQLYDVDLTTEFNKKMIKNDNNYPVSLSKGSNKKYSEI